jgi:hypothetical protein
VLANLAIRYFNEQSYRIGPLVAYYKFLQAFFVYACKNLLYATSCELLS